MPASHMRSALVAAAQRSRGGRARASSLSTVPPAETDEDYLPELAAIAASILYRSPLPSKDGRPVYILNAAAFPDAFEVDYDTLLSYVLARLPGEYELISGTEYEIIFFAGGTPDNATAEKKQGPATGWYLQAYHVLSRALRKKLQMLYIVHPRTWVRVLINVFGTIVSPKFRRKIVHVNSLSALALHIPIEQLLIPPSAYLQDRKGSTEIYAPFVTGKRAFGVQHSLPKSIMTGKTRLPRVLREATAFLLYPDNLNTEGIFRIPPHSTLSAVLKEAYDRGQMWIVWKERGVTLVMPGMDKQLVDEIRLEDAYGVHLAASLIKTWYRELREPVFPESSYAELRARYSDPDVQVSPEDLVDFLLPGSSASPLTPVSREILSRHLLPLLSLVASHEPDNKMNAENLAICFSMCLVCGSNQLEDAKAASIIKRILIAAIEMWSQLRTGMDIDENAFFAELRAPSVASDYEDPLEDVRPRSTLIDVGDEKDGEIGHRIRMNDSDSSPGESPNEKPALPPRRRSRATSLKNALNAAIPNIDLPSLPKRKPAPPHPETPSPYSDHEDTTISGTAIVGEPPRYSTLFGAPSRPLSGTDSPPSYVPTPADGLGPPRREAYSFDSQDSRKFDVSKPPPNVITGLPKRKPVSRNNSVKAPTSEPATSRSASGDDSRQASDPTALLARMAAHQAANNLSQKNVIDTSTIPAILQPGVPNSAPAEFAVKTPEDPVFRKPSWPASATRSQGPNIQSLAKPVLPARKSNTIVPIITGLDGTHLDSGVVRKPRAPSPGLLKRMAGMESQELEKSSSSSSTGNERLGVAPRPLNLRKGSVDDLKRLYEERASTAEALAVVGSGRRASSNH
ncbi:Rho GTPase-activating protein 1 [Pseudocercospora fuligena]|uniref:Rho GTPase-activating protein 1 n=1 Tax=Pseudocercospora fuligena TaxID=685502 RepID=A0A8H6VCB2_9PEZI|nr:Rho GTPase-activating protein 1 [Pseudocercospora fuligena]